jgi:hypothetical protein
MAWTAPRTWVTAELVTAAIMNTHVRDNMKELWREIELVPQTSAVGTPGNGGIIGINAGTTVISLSARTYPGYPVEIQYYTPYAFESATADLSSLVVLGIHEGANSTAPNVKEIGRAAGHGNPPSSGGGGTGPWLSGVFSHRFTPSAAAHTYHVAIWSGNGEGADSAVAAAGGWIRLLERGG